MTKKFAFLIVATMGLAAPAAYAQSVRVITGDIEHIYGPGGQLLDDDALRARNERAEKDGSNETWPCVKRRPKPNIGVREHLLTKPTLVAATNWCKAPDQPDFCWAPRRGLAIFRQGPEHNFA